MFLILFKFGYRRDTKKCEKDDVKEIYQKRGKLFHSIYVSNKVFNVNVNLRAKN